HTLLTFCYILFFLFSPLFFLLLPRPPSSTLFPYTTLFRSAPFFSMRSASCPRKPRALCCGCCRSGNSSESAAASPSRSNSRSCRDRKSTRLNSSHVSISYAVFCLKKKKKKKIMHQHVQEHT